MQLLSLLVASCTLITGALAGGSFPHYPDDVPTFDAKEFFKDATTPTITAYRACQNASGERFTFATCKSSCISDYSHPIEIYPNEYIDVYSHLDDKLTWTGANPKYPLLIGLEKADDGDYRMEREYPGNLVDMKVDSMTLAKTMNFSLFPTLRYPEDMATFIVGIGSETPWQFTIGQPEDPKWKDSNDTQFGRIIDRGSPFFIFGRMYDVMVSAEKTDERNARNFDEKEHKWKLGVGLGVGLGVPVIMILSFYYGKATGKNVKSATSGAKLILVE